MHGRPCVSPASRTNKNALAKFLSGAKTSFLLQNLRHACALAPLLLLTSGGKKEDMGMQGENEREFCFTSMMMNRKLIIF